MATDREVMSCAAGGCDFPSQPRNGSSGNGAFLQERGGNATTCRLHDYAEPRLAANRCPLLAMGLRACSCSRHRQPAAQGLVAEEIMASLAAVLPLNVWSTPVNCPTCAPVGRKFVLRAALHRNLAVVKAQVDFITSKVRDARSKSILFRRSPAPRAALMRFMNPAKRSSKPLSGVSKTIESLVLSQHHQRAYETCRCGSVACNAHVHRRRVTRRSKAAWAR